jgi:hypothetical protein
MNLNIAYLSQGKIYLKNHSSNILEIDSQFGQSVQDRTLQMQRNKAWKNKSMMGRVPLGFQQRMEQPPESLVSVAITSLSNAGDDALLYALSAGQVGGIFQYSAANNREDRLFHNADFQIYHIDYNFSHDLIACSATHPTGISSIAIMPRDGARPREVTEGDSLDLAPRWIPGTDKALVYQSAGLSRTSDGYVGNRAAFTIEKLDFDKQDVVSLAADPKSDLVAPQIGHDGQLYYIRRPFNQRAIWNPLRLFKDILLIPVRLGYAIFQWLNFFSQMYTGKPLLKTDNNQSVESTQIEAWGTRINPQAMRDHNFGDSDAPSLVPPSWQLVRQGAQGSTDIQVLAEGVLSYDLAKDGTILYTNGSGIYALCPDGARDRLHVSKLIESVSVLES